MNKVQLIGRITHDVELKKTPAGKSVVSFRIAVPRKKKEEGADFLNCVAWDGAAEILAKFVSKGDRLAVAGRIQTRSWERDGKRQFAVEIIVDELSLLENKDPVQQSVDDVLPPFRD